MDSRYAAFVENVWSKKSRIVEIALIEGLPDRLAAELLRDLDWLYVGTGARVAAGATDMSVFTMRHLLAAYCQIIEFCHRHSRTVPSGLTGKKRQAEAHICATQSGRATFFHCARIASNSLLAATRVATVLIFCSKFSALVVPTIAVCTPSTFRVNRSAVGKARASCKKSYSSSRNRSQYA